MLSLSLLAIAMVAAVVREYRCGLEPGVAVSIRRVRRARMLGFLLAGFGLIGCLLDAAGYGGVGPTVETRRVGSVLGIAVGGPGYAEGSTVLWRLSALGLAVGLLLVLLGGLALHLLERSGRDDAPRGGADATRALR